MFAPRFGLKNPSAAVAGLRIHPVRRAPNRADGQMVEGGPPVAFGRPPSWKKSSRSGEANGARLHTT
jgi:hypothetical protein